MPLCFCCLSLGTNFCVMTDHVFSRNVQIFGCGFTHRPEPCALAFLVRCLNLCLFRMQFSRCDDAILCPEPLVLCLLHSVSLHRAVLHHELGESSGEALDFYLPDFGVHCPAEPSPFPRLLRNNSERILLEMAALLQIGVF